MDRIDAMRLFVRVADAGSFSKAADEAGIGQPTVSRRIQDLEHRLNAQLFNRTTRSLSLTEAGERFYERATHIVQEFEAAEAEAQGLDHEPVGLLRVTAINSLGRVLIAPLISKFLKKYPHIRMDLVLDDNIVDLVESGIDLGLRMGSLTDSSLMAKRLVSSQRYLVASPQYLEENGVPQRPEDLANHQCLLFRQINNATEWTFTRGDEHVAVVVNGRVKSSSGEVLKRAAVDGMGIFITADWTSREELEAGELVPILCDWTIPPLALNAVWPSGRKLRGKAKLFVDFLSEALKQEFADMDGLGKPPKYLASC